MTNLIIKLLGDHSEDKDKYSKVINEYSRIMMLSQAKNGSSNQLWQTSSRFVQLFDRDMTRSIESAQSLSTSHVNVPDLQKSLKRTSTVSMNALPKPQTPLCSTRGLPDTTDVINRIQNLADPVMKVARRKCPSARKLERERQPLRSLDRTRPVVIVSSAVDLKLSHQGLIIYITPSKDLVYHAFSTALSR